MATDAKITLILDTREQDGLDFSKFRNVDVVRQGLKTGDYSIQCYEDRICFERKSVQDLVGTLIGGHERFLREMERMRDFDAKYILVEHSPTTLYSYCIKHGWDYKFNTIIQSLLAYAYHYQVRVRFCKDREAMAKYIVDKSREFLKNQKERSEECQDQKTLEK